MHDFATIPRERAVVGIHRDAGWSRAPYRAKTKGEVECFIRYLHASFYVPMVSQLSPQGLIVDRDAANARGRHLAARGRTRACRDRRWKSRDKTRVGTQATAAAARTLDRSDLIRAKLQLRRLVVISIR